TEASIVMLHYREQCWKPSVVIEAALGMGPQAVQWRRAVALVRRTVRLEVIHAYLIARMHVPSWLGIQRRRMTRCALSLSAENFFAAFRCLFVEALLRRCGRLDIELIQMQRCKLGRDQI